MADGRVSHRKLPMAHSSIRHYKGPPRWVKYSAIIAMLLELMIGVHFFLGGMAQMHGAIPAG